MDVDHLYPDRHTAQCYPRLIFFPELATQKHSVQIKPMDETNAMLSLIQDSAGIAADRDLVTQHLEVLDLLLHQARSYRLMVAGDVHEKPAAVSQLPVSQLQWDTERA